MRLFPLSGRQCLSKQSLLSKETETPVVKVCAEGSSLSGWSCSAASDYAGLVALEARIGQLTAVRDKLMHELDLQVEETERLAAENASITQVSIL